MLPLRSFQSDPVPFAFSGKGAEVSEWTGTHSVFDLKNPFLCCSYHSCTVPLWKDRYKNRGFYGGTVMYRSIKYRSLPLQNRSFATVFERYFWGHFRSVPLPFFYRSGPFRYRSIVPSTKNRWWVLCNNIKTIFSGHTDRPTQNFGAVYDHVQEINRFIFWVSCCRPQLVRVETERVETGGTPN